MNTLRLSIILTAMILTACGGSGGGSDSDDDYQGSEDQDNPVSGELSFPASEPELTDVTASNGSSVSLNSNISSYISEGGEITFTYQPESDGGVLAVLSSAAEDLDMYITSSADDWESLYDTNSDELIYFNVQRSLSYYITVYAGEGYGDFNLKLVSVNRETAGLEEGESLVKLKTEYDAGSIENCSGIEDVTDTYLIVDWQTYEVEYLSGIRLSFIAVNDYIIAVDEEITATGYHYDATLLLTFDPADGTVTGSTSSTETTTVNGVSSSCDNHSYHTGMIIF